MDVENSENFSNPGEMSGERGEHSGQHSKRPKKTFRRIFGALTNRFLPVIKCYECVKYSNSKEEILINTALIFIILSSAHSATRRKS